jgi:hypothetical protein
MLEDALEVAHKTGSRECEAELCRLKTAKAEECFFNAIDIARGQHASRRSCAQA